MARRKDDPNRMTPTQVRGLELQEQTDNKQPRSDLRDYLHDGHDVGACLQGEVVFSILQSMPRLMTRYPRCRYAWCEIHLLAQAQCLGARIIVVTQNAGVDSIATS